MKRTVIALTGALSVMGMPVIAQTTQALTKPTASFADPFTNIASVRELPSGKVIVSDNRDKVVQLIDLAGGTATKIGREGQGPAEYAMPLGLLAQPNGETWLNDVLGRRFLVIDPTGKPTRTFTLPATGGPGGGIVMFGGGNSGTDAAGRFYYQAPPFGAGGPGAPPPDSLAILRWETGKTSSDTVAYFQGPKAQINSSGGGTQMRVMIGGGKVFAPTEAWGVAGDGSIARVYPSPYRVVWYPATSKTATAGPTQPYTPIKVTDADKKEVIEARKRNPGMQIRMSNGRASSGGGPAPQLPEPEFEETKPPFTGANSVLVTPEGEVWVRRTQPAGTANPSYDIFDRTGKLARKASLNPKSQVIGFGKGTIYVIRTDEDDLQYLERYAR